MRQDYWQLGTWGRIPVSMHWTVLLLFAWLYLIFWDFTATLIGAVAAFVLLVAHEYGHVFELRRRKIAITGIALFGIHGETSYNEYAAKPADVIAVAWAGVAAQVVVLVLAVAANAMIPFSESPLAATIWGPMYLVFIRFNVFLMIVALLPIGPFDGHAAWQVIPRTRKALRRPAKKRAPVAAPVPEPEPEPIELPEEQRELDESSRRQTEELMARLSRKSDAPTQDR